MKSIRHFLLLALCVVMTSVMGMAAWFSYRDSVHEIDEIFDARLAQYARLLAATAVYGSGSIIPVPEKNGSWIGHKYEARIAFQIWQDSVHLLTASENAGARPLAAFVQGFHNEVRDGNSRWRVFVLHDSLTQDWVMVAERHDVRLELVREIAGNAVLPAVLGTVVALLLMSWVLSRGFRPLQVIADAITHRRADDLASLQFDNIPAEVAALVDNINALLQRVRHSLERERRFSADAAHEIKTPLAAIKLQLANLQSQARQEDLPLVSGVLRSCDDMQRMVEQLLVFNRLEPACFAGLQQPVNLLPLCREVMAQEAEFALQKNQELSLEGGDDALVLLSDPTLLQVLLRNLVHNAVCYTQTGGSVQLCVSREASQVLLEVCDNGPGIPESEREKVFERFYRVDADRHASGVQGSGLGLAIAQEIVRLHAGTIALHSGRDGCGLCVQVKLPLR